MLGEVGGEVGEEAEEEEGALVAEEDSEEAEGEALKASRNLDEYETTVAIFLAPV